MRARILKLMGVQFADISNVLISSGVYMDEWNPQLIRIGRNVGIAIGVKILTHFYDINQPPHHHKIGPVIIEDDASLLFNVVVADSVTIGRGAVVGANSVITKDIPPYAIAVGSPCKPIGKRPRIVEDIGEEP
jgi:acetyltransferase-like isoleucine patch superfamily enzyme